MKLPLLLSLLAATSTVPSLFGRPNVVMLLSDDLGYQDIGCYGGPVKTPALDKLAEGGTRFSDSYSGTIDNEDQAIGRLLAKLKEIDDSENTLIIYGSDNGSYRDDRTGGLRGRKGMNWEGGIRVPGIFNWPGTISANRLERTPAGLVDVLPTVCGLLGLKTPRDIHLDGTDLSSLLTGNGADFARRQPLFWHLQKGRPIVAMRDGDYSLVAEPDFELSTDNMFDEAWIPAIKSGSYKNYQFFNLKIDPKQEKNIASRNPELVDRLRKKLLEINAGIMADGPDWHLMP